MPEFASIHSMLNPDRKINKAELIRTIRYFISAEYEAVQLYMQLAESTDNELAKKVLIDIAEEEIVHAGEFLRLLKEIYPEEFEFYKQGKEEVEELWEKK
jgi:rubrerythrin